MCTGLHHCRMVYRTASLSPCVQDCITVAMCTGLHHCRHAYRTASLSPCVQDCITVAMVYRTASLSLCVQDCITVAMCTGLHQWPCLFVFCACPIYPPCLDLPVVPECSNQEHGRFHHQRGQVACPPACPAACPSIAQCVRGRFEMFRLKNCPKCDTVTVKCGCNPLLSQVSLSLSLSLSLNKSRP